MSPRRPWTSMALAAVLAASSGLALTSPSAAAYSPRAPILIVGDTGFTASNGVLAGAGTSDDPYRIEGWEIDASAAHGIEVRNTNAHFLIRGVFVHSGGPGFYGILFQSVSNASISGSVVQYNANGIRLVDSRAVTVSGNDATLNTFDGVSVAASSSVIIGGSRIEHNGDGISLESVEGLRVAGNTVALNRQDGLFAYNVTDALVEGNAFSENSWTGLHVSTTTNATIGANTVSSNARAGMNLELSAQLTVRGNAVFGNGGGGILMHSVQGLVLSANDVTLNGQTGISIELAWDAVVTKNVVSGNPYVGIVLAGAERATVADNWVTNNTSGISFLFSREARASDNRVLHSAEYGVYVADVENLTVDGNVLSENSIGVGIEASRNITVRENEIRGATYGLFLFRSSAVRTFHNNLTANTVHGLDDRGAENVWDDGYPSGGNHWSGYGGIDRCSGANQSLCPRADGIGDLPYSIDTDSADRYPLMRPYGTRNRAPVAVLVVVPLEGDTATTFTADATLSADDEDLPGTLEARWDWEDDGVWDTSWSAEKVAEHRYPAPGNYTVRLQVRDSGGIVNTTTIRIGVRSLPLPDVLPWAALAIVAGAVAVAGYWGYRRWRLGWFRRARQRERRRDFPPG